MVRDSIQNHRIKSQNKYFFDTNIWIYTLGNNKPGSSESAVYSKLLHDLVLSKADICINNIVVSEFINRFMWFVCGQDPNNKPFMKTNKYRQNTKNAYNRIIQIMSFSKFVNDPLVNNHTTIFGVYDGSSYGFNDLLIGYSCIENNCILVTHDADFKPLNIDIISGNPKAL